MREKESYGNAYDLLALVYNGFTKGFETADLQEAKVLMTELESSSYGDM